MTKSFVVGFVLAGALLPAAGQAQALIDLTRVTCADYLAMPPADSKVFSAWLSGWLDREVARLLWISTNIRARSRMCSRGASSTRRKP